MADTVVFTLAAIGLLSTPGPTNTLLVISGATSGFAKSLRLLPAEMMGYALSITLLSAAARYAGIYADSIGFFMRLAACVYLVKVACALWSASNEASFGCAHVSFSNVFTTTLLNPKNLIFTFGIVPYAGTGELARAAPYIACLLVIVALVASCWICFGATLEKGSRGSLNLGAVRRGGAVVLATFAAIIFCSAVMPSA